MHKYTVIVKLKNTYESYDISGTSKLKNLAGVLGAQILCTVFMYLKVVWYIGQVK